MDVSEVPKALRTALLADDELVSLLASEEAFYYDFPAGPVLFPALMLDTRGWNPQTQISATGVYRPEWQLDIFCVDPYRALAIWGRLENAWTIPLARPAGIASTHYRITQLVWRDVIDVGPFRVVDTGEQVRQWACEIGLKIVEKTGARDEDDSSSSGP